MHQISLYSKRHLATKPPVYVRMHYIFWGNGQCLVLLLKGIIRNKEVWC